MLLFVVLFLALPSLETGPLLFLSLLPYSFSNTVIDRELELVAQVFQKRKGKERRKKSWKSKKSIRLQGITLLLFMFFILIVAL